MAQKKGVVPNTYGIAGQLVRAVPESVVFGSRLRQSPYDPLLLQLRSAGAGNYLRFDGLAARASVYARAKKLGIKVLFGEEGSVLWVALAEVPLQRNGTVDEPQKVSNADLVIAAIKAKRTTAGEITTWMRSNGAPGIGITQVDGLMGTLARAGKIKLVAKPVDGMERWQLAGAMA